MAIDWSGAAGQHLPGIAMALCSVGTRTPRLITPTGHRHWSRQGVLDYLLTALPHDTLVGMDLGISLPFADAGAFFPGWDQSPSDARALWRFIDEICVDAPHLAVSHFVNHTDASAYFRRHGGHEGQRFHHPQATHRRGRLRITETAQERLGCKPYSNFNLVGAAQVGKSSLTGMRLLNQLQRRLFVWPVDGIAAPSSGSVLVEIYTTIAAIAGKRSAGRSKMRTGHDLDDALGHLDSAPTGIVGPIDDHSCDALITAAWLRRHAQDEALWNPENLHENIAKTEGWTFGAT